MIDYAKFIEHIEPRISPELLQALKERLVVAPLHGSVGEAHQALVQALDAIELERDVENKHQMLEVMERAALQLSWEQEEKFLKGFLR